MTNLFNKKSPKGSNKYNWTAISILAVFLFISALFFPVSQNFIKLVSSRVAMFADVLSSTLVLGTNDFRSINNENNLVESPLLTTAAQMKANDMASKGYFSHIAPNGDNPWVWFNRIGYKYSYAGENLAVDFDESADVTAAWINSAKHKANLLNSNFTEIGIGIAKGIYEGHSTTFVVQFFGKSFIKEKSESIVSATNHLASTSPETAVATKSGLPNGEVLGTEINNTVQINNDNQMRNLTVMGISFLAIIMIILKFITIKGEKKL